MNTNFSRRNPVVKNQVWLRSVKLAQVSEHWASAFGKLFTSVGFGIIFSPIFNFNKIIIISRYRTQLIVTSKEKQASEMPMLKSNYFDQVRPGAEHLDSNKGHKSQKNFVERPNSLAGMPCSPAAAARLKELNECSPFGAFASEPREDKGLNEKPSGLPEDLCDMFSTLLLDPEETMPIEVSSWITLWSRQSVIRIVNNSEIYCGIHLWSFCLFIFVLWPLLCSGTRREACCFIRWWERRSIWGRRLATPKQKQ